MVPTPHARPPRQRPAVSALLLCLLPLLVAPGPAQAQSHPLVFVQAGELPLVLSAPHGGTNPVPGAARRQSGTLVTDSYTLELTLATARELERALGARPFVVALLAKREFLDVNRRLEDALEAPAARPIYHAYHHALSNAVAAVRRRFPGGGLLLDVHGQRTEPGKIVRGTVNGLTVQQMLQRHGHAALGGPDSVLGRLAAAGYDIVPPNTPAGRPAEMSQYVGGHIVRTYGSHQPHGIDAIQLEIGMALRTPREAREKLARDLAAALAAYHRRHLAPPAAAPAR